MYQNLIVGVALLLISLASQPASPAQQQPSAKLSFNRDIRPILSEHCFACHGPDKNKRKGKLRLDDRDAALAKQAFVPGKANESHLVERIFAKDESEKMPPDETNKPLSEIKKRTLKRWIEEGADYQAHWAYIVPTRPAVPTVKNTAWIRTPIDAFILAQLEARNIKPSPEVDRATLLRRLSLDLIGLPPTWDAVQDAINSKNDDWYEKAVDRLLATPQYGERMAVHWLDLVRYADTVGYHGDQNQRIFPYRDYVINAFNSNMPFDRFTLEQIAGDLLPNATVDQKVASGFNRLNMMTREGGAQPAEYLAKYAADRVRTVAGTWLGSTVGCAECHDHKYDPFTSKDFYSLGAYFADLKQWGVYQDYGYTPNPDLKGWSNDHPFPPEIEVESRYLKERMAKLLKQMNAIAGKVHDEETKQEPILREYSQWLKQILSVNAGWETPHIETSFGDMPASKRKKPSQASSKTSGAENVKSLDLTHAESESSRTLDDGSALIRGPVKSAPQFSIQLPSGWVSTLKIELLPHPEHKNSVLRNNSTSVTFKPTFQLLSKDQAPPTPVTIRFAEANYHDPIYRNGFDQVGIKEGWRISSQHRNDAHVSLWWLEKPFKATAGDQLLVNIPTNLVGNVRISVSGYAPLGFIDSQAMKPFWGIHHDNADVRFKLRPTALDYLRSTGWHKETFAEIKRLEKEYYECRNGKAWTQVSEALSKPVMTRVLPRGNFLDQSGPVVQPAPPAFLKAKDIGSSRLDLARWLTSADNPLTSRAVVNRFWKMFFGNGISNVLDDLGAQGEWPTHPELLDWLAVEFRDSGWNVKHIVKLMVMSSVYRQSAITRTDLKEIDPNNRLLAAQNPRRLDAEFIRDQALFVCGLLNKDLGGPSSFPYQPAGYYSLIQFPDRNYVASKDDRQYRRGLYSHWQRMFLQPMLANFDAPSREECTACRVVANTPQQALTLLNDPTFVEAARVLAESLLVKPGEDGARLELVFLRVLSRAPKAAERESLLQLLASQRKHYQANLSEADALLKVGNATRSSSIKVDELAAWTNLMRVLLNLHEVVTRY